MKALCRDPIQCIVPPYITERLAESPDAAVRSREIANVKVAVAMRAMRRVLHALDQQQAIELLLDKMKQTKSNVEFLMQIQKTTPTPGNGD